jgi:hypothetical protein
MPRLVADQSQAVSRTGLFANRLVRELFVVLAVKLLVLYGLWFAFFRQPDHQPLTIEQVSAAVAGGAAVHPGSGARDAR